MDISTVYVQLSGIYERNDPDNQLRKQTFEDEQRMSSVYRCVRNEKASPCDNVRLTSDGDLSISWLDGVLKNKIDLPLDLCNAPDRECIQELRSTCLDATREIETEIGARKAKYPDSGNPITVDSSYKSVGAEVEECLLLIRELTEKIKKIESDKSIQKMPEYSKEIDENLKIFANNVTKIEQFITAMRKFSDLQKLHESFPDTKVYDSGLVRGIEQLAHRAQRVAYILKHNE